VGAPVATAAGAERADVPGLRTGRMRRGIGLPGAAHLVALETAVAAIALATLTRDPVVLGATSAAAFVLIVIVFGRVGGRWWYQWLGARMRFRRRRVDGARTRATMAAAQPWTAAMAGLASRLTIRAVEDRGRTIGVGQDQYGWFAALELAPWEVAYGERDIRLELDRLARLLDETVMPVSAVQVVSYHLTATRDDSPAARSYRELTPEGCALDQTVWLAVRLSPADAAEAAATRGGGVEGVDRAMAATVGRVEKILASTGAVYETLDADGLREAIGYACGLDAGGPATGPPRERWSGWTSGGLAHVSFTIVGWPSDPAPDLARNLAQVPAFAVSVATVLRPYGERAGLLGVVRVVTRPDGVRPAVKQLLSNASRLGLRLRRFDGEQAPGVYATAPTGGGGI